MAARTRRIATISSQYGNADEATAMTMPIRIASPWPATLTPPTSRSGVASTVAPSIMSAVTESGSMPVTARLASSRYAPQQTPAERASSRPMPVAAPEGPARTTTPAPASTIHSQSSLRRVPRTATPSGPTNSMATTMPTGTRLIAP